MLSWRPLRCWPRGCVRLRRRLARSLLSSRRRLVHMLRRRRMLSRSLLNFPLRTTWGLVVSLHARLRLVRPLILVRRPGNVLLRSLDLRRAVRLVVLRRTNLLVSLRGTRHWPVVGRISRARFSIRCRQVCSYGSRITQGTRSRRSYNGGTSLIGLCELRPVVAGGLLMLTLDRRRVRVARLCCS